METGGCLPDRKLKDWRAQAVVLISSPREKLWFRKKKEEMKCEQLMAVSLKNWPKGHLIRGENARLSPEDAGSCGDVCREGVHKAQEEMTGKWVKAICNMSKVYTPLRMHSTANETNFFKNRGDKQYSPMYLRDLEGGLDSTWQRDVGKMYPEEQEPREEADIQGLPLHLKQTCT